MVEGEQKKPNGQSEEVALEARQARAARIDAFLALVAQSKWEEAAANLPDLSFMTVSLSPALSLLSLKKRDSPALSLLSFFLRARCDLVAWGWRGGIGIKYRHDSCIRIIVEAGACVRTGLYLLLL